MTEIIAAARAAMAEYYAWSTTAAALAAEHFRLERNTAGTHWLIWDEYQRGWRYFFPGDQSAPVDGSSPRSRS